MCTLVAFHRVVPDAPLVIAANRDEFLDRPAEGFALRPGGVLAPRDLREGGTWMGLNRYGLFAGLTNRARGGTRDPARRSRGHAVFEVLRGARSAQSAARLLEGLPVGAYNPFHLLVADGRAAWLAVYENAPKVFALQPGLHVIGNRDPAGAPGPKEEGIRRACERFAGRPLEMVVAGAAAVLADHADGDTERAACVHREGYGTRSAAILALGRSGRGRLLFASGPPCRTPFRDESALLRELAGDATGRAAATRSET